MKRLLFSLVSLCVLTVLVGGLIVSQAQGRGPVVDILGKPEPISGSPDVRAYLSVVDSSTGRIIDGLSDGNFSVRVSDEEIEATSSLGTTGVAVVMIIDRGGIARGDRKRVGEAVDLAENLLGRLNVDGSESADMVALIGIRGRDQGGLTPLVELTDWDPNSVSNEFDVLRNETVDEVTPLYDGIDQAIEWLVDNPDSEIQDKLTHRRPVIFVFSDGIDNRFSSEAHETIIINKCLENDILLYAIRMEGGSTDEDNLEALATQTNGIYASHNEETHEQVQGLFGDIVTQRQSYRLEFPLLRPKGDYELRVRVLDTPFGDGSDVSVVSSRLQLPQVVLTSPTDGVTHQVPYSHTPRLEISLGVELTFPDGVVRDPSAVRYYRDRELIATSTAPPFDVSWDATDYVTQTEPLHFPLRGTEEMPEAQQNEVRDFTFTAEADDAYLGETVTSPPVGVRVEWEPLPPPTFMDRLQVWLRTYWWMLVILAALTVGLLVLLVLLIRTRGEVARKMVTRTTGVLKGVTKRLSAAPQRAPGKLVIVQGANAGKELRLAAQVVKVGRDPQFCDLALHDDYVSNPHFSIHLEQTQFYIVDEGSTNGTRVNGAPIPPHQRVLLQPEAMIELGSTRLQFKRLGGTTRQLRAQPAPSSSQGQGSLAATQRSRGSDLVQGPPHVKGSAEPDSGRQGKAS